MESHMCKMWSKQHFITSCSTVTVVNLRLVQKPTKTNWPTWFCSRTRPVYSTPYVSYPITCPHLWALSHIHNSIFTHAVLTSNELIRFSRKQPSLTGGVSWGVGTRLGGHSIKANGEAVIGTRTHYSTRHGVCQQWRITGDSRADSLTGLKAR